MVKRNILSVICLCLLVPLVPSCKHQVAQADGPFVLESNSSGDSRISLANTLDSGDAPDLINEISSAVISVFGESGDVLSTRFVSGAELGQGVTIGNLPMMQETVDNFFTDTQLIGSNIFDPNASAD